MMMGQLENRLKMSNPQAFKKYQEAKHNNVNPNEFLNEITSGFNQQQQAEWQNIINGIK